MFLKVSLLD